MRMQATAKLAEAGTTQVGQDNSLGGGSAGGVRVSCEKDGRPRRCRLSKPEIQTLDTADLSRAATYLRYTADEWVGDEDRMTETKETTAATTPRTVAVLGAGLIGASWATSTTHPGTAVNASRPPSAGSPP